MNSSLFYTEDTAPADFVTKNNVEGRECVVTEGGLKATAKFLLALHDGLFKYSHGICKI